MRNLRDIERPYGPRSNGIDTDEGEVRAVRKLAMVGICLLLGLLAGLVLRPDDGTQVSISSPGETGAMVSGANHGKPLPRVPSAGDLLRTLGALAAAVALLAVTATPSYREAPLTTGDLRPRQALLLRACARRGPPASV